MKTVTTSVGFQDPLGNLVLSGNLVLTLSQAAEVTSGGGLIAPKVVVLPLSATTAKIASTQIYFSDELTPSGTTYHAELLDSGGNIIADFGQWSITGASADLSTMIPTSIGGPSAAGVVLTAPAATQTVIQPVGTSLNVNRFQRVRYVDSVNSQGWAGADPGSWINAAAADAGTFGTVVLAPVAGGTYPNITTALVLPRGLTLKFPPGVFGIVGGNTIANIGVTILGSGRQSTYLEPTSATGDIFTVTGANLEVGDLSILAAVPRTSGAAFNIQAAQCLFRNMFISDMFDGFVQGTGASSNTFRDIVAVGSGGNWRNVFRNGPLAAGTIPGTTIDGFIIVLTGSGSTITGTLFLLDSGTDSTKIDGLEISRQTGADTNFCFQIAKTAAGQAPSYVVLTNSYCETTATNVAAQIDNCLLFSAVNWKLALGLQGLKITGGKGINIHNGSIWSAQQGAVVITGGSAIEIIGMEISDCAVAAANTYDAISVSAGVSDFRILGNRIGNWLFAGNTFRNGVNIAAGASDKYVVMGNTIDGFGTSEISDGGTGVVKTVWKTGTNLGPVNLVGVGAGNTVSLISIQGFTGSITGTGAAANIYSITITGNQVAANKAIRVTWSGSHSTGTANVTLTMNLNGVTLMTGTSGTAASQPLFQQATIYNSGATTGTVMGVNQSGNALVPAALSTGSLAWASNQTLTVQFNVANTDAVTGYSMTVELLQ